MIDQHTHCQENHCIPKSPKDENGQDPFKYARILPLRYQEGNDIMEGGNHVEILHVTHQYTVSLDWNAWNVVYHLPVSLISKFFGKE